MTRPTMRALLCLPALLFAGACDQKTDVGKSCEMEAPCTDAGCGFDGSESYLDRSGSQCEEACVVHRSEEGAGMCTCRCNGPKNSKDFCECPDGFACRDVLGLSDLSESMYCVRMP